MSQDQWQAHIEAFERSGLSRRAYVSEHGLVYHQFQYWYRKLKVVAKPSEFIALKLATAPSPTSTPSLGVLELANGAQLTIHSREVLAYLPQLMRGE